MTFAFNAPADAAFASWADGLDSCAGLVERWIEWQSMFWQPLLDAQGEFVRQWQALAGWSGADAVLLRGTEQLA